ncbi:response regulator [Sphingomonas sp.]|uniref:response regulator transcription factor n=1 Tax=Sphingomonas sp. TaxID=28214 RepID=UPI001EB322A8|nr:response regulator [Sphingomonas sp.]MBX3593364.1 response regulator transcription factor [Sphingomonas sp.]
MTDARVVHIVDDEESVRRSVGFLLKTSGFTTHAWDSGTAFLRQAKHAEPGCVLLDLRMPEMDGLEVQRRLNAAGVALPVILLTGHGDVSSAVAAMKEGAVDFLEKPFEKARLIQALDTGFGKLEQSHAADLAAHEAETRLAALTPREREVLAGLVAGQPNKTIAFDLGISARTVEVHRANVMTKLGVRSLSEALRIAFAAGLGGPPADAGMPDAHPRDIP